jgi:hypothetical protein
MALFHKQVSSMGVGLEIVVGETRVLGMLKAK